MASSRYNTSSMIIDEKTGKRRLSLFPAISAAYLRDINDIIISTQDGDTLDHLAYKHLGNGRYWWMIALLNDISLPLGDFLEAGTILIIPTDTDKFFNALDNKEGEK